MHRKPQTMKTIQHRKAIGLAAFSLITLLAGCAARNSDRAAVACPDCRTVVERNNPNYERYGYAFPEEAVRHECPGCQGALTTLFTEGRLVHKCSRCEGMPYSCSISHR